MRQGKQPDVAIERGAWCATLTPGEIIRKRFFDPLGMTQAELCDKYGLERSSFNRILNGTQSISARSATDLSRAFGMSAMFFLNLQNRHDLFICERDGK